MPNTCETPDTRRASGATLRDVFRDAVRCAWVAPSNHDVPPWVLHVRDDAIELVADRQPAESIEDPDGRESIISCGAALFHVRAALRARGYATAVERSADATDSRGRARVRARVRLAGSHTPTAADRALVAAITRATHHGLVYDDRSIAPHVLSLLLGAARAEGAWLAYVDAPILRRALAELVAEATQRQIAAARLRRTAAVGTDAPDGGPVVPARLLARVERAPTVAVLATPGDTLGDWMVAGQALARVLLTARAAGVGASYLNQPVEVADLRPRVAGLVRDAGDPGVPGRRGGMPSDTVPQIVLRLGYPSPPPPTGHRAPDDQGPTGSRAA